MTPDFRNVSESEGGNDAAPARDEEEPFLVVKDTARRPRILIRPWRLIFRLPPEERVTLYRTAALGRRSPAEYVTLFVHSALHEKLDEREGARTETFTAEFPAHLAKKLRATAELLNREPGETLRLLAQMAPEPEEVARFGDHSVSFRPRFGVKARQARRIERLAALLDLPSRQMFAMIVNDALDALEDPAGAPLLGLIENRMKWDSPEDMKRAKARAERWLKTRNAREAGRAA